MSTTVSHSLLLLTILVLNSTSLPARADDLIRCLQLYYILTIKKEATKYLGLTIAVD
jgi:hypothetical protein